MYFKVEISKHKYKYDVVIPKEKKKNIIIGNNYAM